MHHKRQDARDSFDHTRGDSGLGINGDLAECVNEEVNSFVPRGESDGASQSYPGRMRAASGFDRA